MTRSSRALPWLLPALAVPALLLLGFGLTRDARELPSALVDRPAPEFRLATLSGDSLGLAELRGRVTVLNFWASWCIPCRQEHDVLARTTRTYGADSVAVVGVLYDDSPANGRRFMEALGGEWPSVVDPGSRTAIDYGVYGVPETFFLAADGTVARKHVGPVSWELVRGVVDSLLAAGAGRFAPGPLESAPPGDSADSGARDVVPAGAQGGAP